MKKWIALCTALAVCIGCLSSCAQINVKKSDAGSGDVTEITLNKPEDGIQTDIPETSAASGISASPNPEASEPASSAGIEKKDKYERIISHDKIEQFDGTIKIGDTGYELYNYLDSAAKSYADVINGVAKKLNGVSDVYDIVAPTSIGITLPDNKVQSVNSSNQRKAIKSIYKKLSKRVKTVSLYHTLMKHRTEYIFFRTDHHWTDKGAYYAYQKFCKKKDFIAHDLTEYKKAMFGDYLGSFYLDTNKAESLRKDRVRAFYPVDYEKIKLTYQDEQGTEHTAGVISDGAGYGISLKYVAFLSGDNSFSVVENKRIKDGSSCLVVKESYGNTFVPFLADHYQKIYVVDYRYWTGSVSDFALKEKVDDVIFLNNISMTRNAYLIGKLAQVK